MLIHSIKYRIFLYTAQKMKFSIKVFLSKCDQINWSHLLKKSLMESFIFFVQSWFSGVEI